MGVSRAKERVRGRRDTRRARNREAALVVLSGLEGAERTPEETAAQALAVGLGYRWAAVCRHSADHRRAHMLAFWDDGVYGATHSYDLRGTPCAEIPEDGNITCFDSGVAAMFPADTGLACRGAEAFQGRLVYDPETHEVIGHVLAFDDRPDPSGPDELVEMVARWVGLQLGRVAALEALRASERRFRDLAEISYDWFWETDADHRFTRCYGNKEILPGDTGIDDLLGKTPWEVAGVDPDADPAWRSHRRLLDRREPFRDFAMEVGNEEGRRNVLLVSGIPIFGDDGAFRGYWGTTRDITEQIAAQEAIAESRARFEDVLEHTPVANAITGLDTGIVHYANRKWLELSGVEESELGSVRIFEFYADPGERKRLSHVIDREGAVNGVRTTFRSRSGRDLPVLLSAVRTEYDGEPALVAGWIDMSDQVAAKDALRESERRLRDFAEAASDWFWEMDADLRFTYVSPSVEDGLGYPPETFVGRNPHEALGGLAEHPEWRRQLADMRARRPFRSARLVALRPDGTEVQYIASGKPLYDDDGRFVGYRGTSTDVTALVAAEREASVALRRLTDAIEAVAAGIALWDADERLVICNSRFRDMFDAETKALAVPGVAFADLMRTHARSGVLDLTEEQRTAWIERRLNRRDPAAADPEPLPRMDGRITELREHPTPDGGIISLYYDVTDRARAEQALRESEERYALAMAGASEHLWDWRPATDDIVTDPRVLARIGLPTDPPILDRHYLLNAIHPEDREAYEAQFRAHMRGDVPQFDAEYRLRMADGCYRWYRTRGVALRDASGRVERVAGSTTDIGARKAAEEALRESEARYRHVFEAGPVGMTLFDTDQRYLMVNDQFCAVVGYERDELIGRPIDEITHPEDIVVNSGRFADILKRADDPVTYRKRYVRKDGEIVHADVVSVLIEGADGERLYGLSMIQDVTERLRAEEAIRERDDRLQTLQAELLQVSRATAMGEMASAIAHEVNQPLAAVMNYVQAARDLLGAPPDDDRVSGFLDKATDQADRAATIVRRLRNFFVRGEIERVPDDINVAVEEAVHLAVGRPGPAGPTVELDLARRLPAVAFDRLQVQQVVLNLVRNAMEAVEGVAQPCISVVTARDRSKGAVAVAVRDNGPGIDPKIRERLFQPFVTSKGSGMGMGLSISASIVEAHGGRLEAVEADGGGTEFRFTLPVTAV